MKNEEDLGFIETPSGKVNIQKYLVFDETEKRQYKIILTEDNNILIVLDSKIHGDDKPVKQQMYLTKESFALMFLSMTKAKEHFNINLEEELNKILVDGSLPYYSYPAINLNEE